MTTVIIQNKTYVPALGAWFVSCSFTSLSGSRFGTETVTGPDTMTDEELKAAIGAMY